MLNPAIPVNSSGSLSFGEGGGSGFLPLIILKTGGNVIDNPQVLDAVLRDFAAWQGNKILVHGGGKIAGKLMEKLGIVPRMVEGRRITDRETLDIVTMVYAGLINKNMVAALQKHACNAIGLTGADANLIPAAKRPVKDIDYGFVGDVNPDRISVAVPVSLVKSGLVPVVAPITHDGAGSLLNTNADTIVSSIAIALAKTFKVQLVFCFEKKGVLHNPDDEHSAIDVLDEALYREYKEKGIITAGMIPKIDNAFAALRSGVAEIRICSPENLTAGTRIKMLQEISNDCALNNL
jgi:acetylglutamate kinase